MDNHYWSRSRRTFLAGTAGAVVGVGVLGRASVPTLAKSDATGDEQWTQPGENAARTSANVAGVGPAGEISIAWKGDLGSHYGDSTVGAVVDGTVYATGSGMVAFDATDGKKLWGVGAEIPDREFPESGIVWDIEAPTVMDGAVFAPIRFGVYDADEAFHTALVAVDADSGEKLWRRDVPVGDEFSTLTAAGDTLFVNGPDMDGGDGNFLYALNPDDGSVRWRQSRVREHTEYHTPVIVDGLVFVTPPTGLKAFDVESGDLVWEGFSHVKDLWVELGSEGTLFVSGHTDPGVTIIALDVAMGDEMWKQAYSGDIDLRIHTVDTERLYLSTSEDDGDIVALDRSTGNERWRTTIPQPSSQEQPRLWIPRRGMARVGELLYVGATAVQPSDGEILWKQELRESPAGGYSLDAVAGGQMYISDRGMGGGLVVLDGTKTQTTTTPTPQPDETDRQDDTAQQQTTNGQTESRSTDGTPSPPTTESTPDLTNVTPTDGPGFGVLAAVAGIGVVAWRYLQR